MVSTDRRNTLAKNPAAPPHDLEGFSIELGVARWNDMTFVPEKTFADVVKEVIALHGLEDYKPRGPVIKNCEILPGQQTRR